MARINREMLSAWYEVCGAELRLYALQWHDHQSAEDIVQEAFIKLLKQRRCPDHVRAWLFRVVRNSSISAKRCQQRRKRVDQRYPQTHGCWFETPAGTQLDAQQAQAVLETLPAERREIVVLRIWGQMSLKEIAAIIHKSIPWVHREYQATLALVRTKLEQSPWQKKQA